MKNARPQLSIVITIVEGGSVLTETIDRLLAQGNDSELELLLPFDDSVAAEVEHLRGRDPRLQLVPLGPIMTQRPKRSAAGQHELFDRRRAAGLAAARGELIAILEDRGLPADDWVAQACAAHAASTAAAIGGPVLSEATALMAQALYFCDFSRYQPPVPAGPAAWVTDVNIVYKRADLLAHKELWSERYHETTVHWQLQRDGKVLELAPKLRVFQRRGNLCFSALMSERFQWGRLFAYTRAREMPLWRRPVYALLALLLPFLLFFRHARLQLQKRNMLAEFCRCSPLVFIFLVAWSTGEAAAYLGAKP